MLEEYPVTEFLVLPGHHLYKMDYQKLIEAHRGNRAEVTVSVLSRAEDEDLGFGVCAINAENRVLEFREMNNTDDLNSSAVKCDDQILKCNYPSMGIYVINRDIMIKLLTEHYPTVNDLKSQVIPGAISLGMKVGFSYI